jgi:hypothetical protein
MPNTVCVRVLASSLHRVQPATCCCKTSNDNTAGPEFADAWGASNNDEGAAAFQPVCLGDIGDAEADVAGAASIGDGAATTSSVANGAACFFLNFGNCNTPARCKLSKRSITARSICARSFNGIKALQCQ